MYFGCIGELSYSYGILPLNPYWTTANLAFFCLKTTTDQQFLFLRFVHGTFICISKYALDHSDKISGDNAAAKQTKGKENKGSKLYA